MVLSGSSGASSGPPGREVCMEPDFWKKRWERGQIGFHRNEVHPLLERHMERLGGGVRVLVPLAGKTVDLRYLGEHGYEVVGVELVEEAVQDFFSEAGWSASIDTSKGYPVYRGQGVELQVTDFLLTTPRQLGPIRAVYDRASLVALPPAMRARYAAHMASLLPKGATVLMITVDYDVQEMSGPPFSVPPAEVEAIFGGPFEVSVLESMDALGGNPGLQARGLTSLREHALWLRRRG